MALNTDALKETIRALRQRIAEDTNAIETLERILGHVVDEKAEKPRRKYTRKKVTVRKPRPTKKRGQPKRGEGSNSDADEIRSSGRRKSPFPIRVECDKCEREWVRKGPRSKCPHCFPKAEAA